jgi:NhaP-type Na+/H+ and K+/H+ antiporter
MVSWVGLKGSVPIILGTYPLMAGLPGGRLLFDITFFVVLVSATFQGWSLAPVARWLGLQLPPRPEPPVTLEISSLRHIEGDIVEYTVNPDSRATGQKLRDLDFPESAVVAMIARDQQVIPPRGRTRIEPGDHVFIVLRPEARPLVDRVFTSRGEEEDDDDEPGAGPATDGGQRNSLVSPVAPTTLAAPASPANSASPVAPAASAALRLPGTGPASSTERLGAIEAPLSQELDAEER